LSEKHTLGASPFGSDSDLSGVGIINDRIYAHAKLQRLAASISADGMTVFDTDFNGDNFSWRLHALGRRENLKPVSLAKKLGVTDSLGTVHREGVVEEFSSSIEGIRQDFLVAIKPAGAGQLVLDIRVGRALLRPTPGDATSVSIRISNGRILSYRNLHVIDASGKLLPASFVVMSDHMLRIEVDDSLATYPIRVDPTFSDGDWVAIAEPGFDVDIATSIVGGGDLYVGGPFGSAPGTSARGVARWDGSTWWPLGNGVDGSVSALAWDDSTNRLFVGGSFSQAGEVEAANIAVWNGSTWQPLGAGTDDSVRAMAFDEVGARLFVGGVFDSAGGLPAARIAMWDGSQWQSLSTGTSGTVSALAWNETDSELYAAGSFNGLSGVAAKNVAVWDGLTWAPLAQGISGSYVSALLWVESQSKLYVGGNFTAAGLGAANNIAVWDGVSWSSIGSGVSNDVRSFAWDTATGRLYAGGVFNFADTTAANHIAVWDGLTWSPLAAGASSIVHAMAWDSIGSQLYAAGDFTTDSGSTARQVGRWDGSKWNALDNDSVGITNGDIYAVEWDATNARLFVGGAFSRIAGVVASGLAVWDGATWSSLNYYPATIFALTWDDAGEQLFVGGSFDHLESISANNVARLSGPSLTATTLGSGVDGAVRALAWDSTNATLFAGGQFANAGGLSANRVAQWSGGGWAPLGAGVNDDVRALIWNASLSSLYVGGYFTEAGGNSAQRVASWNGSSWSPMSTGMNGGVRALALDEASGRVFAGGLFSMAGSSDAQFTAVWDGLQWDAMGMGFDGAVNSLVWDPVYERLFAGGEFSGSGDLPTSRVASFANHIWTPLGSGADAPVLAMDFDNSTARIFVGGQFSEIGNTPANAAYALTFPSQGDFSLSATPALISFGDQSTLEAIGGQGVGDVSFFIAAGSSYCELNAGAVLGVGVGQCVVGAIKDGDDVFAEATATTVVEVERAEGTVNFGLTSFVYDGSPHTPTAYIVEEPESACVIAEAPIGPGAGSYSITASCNGTNFFANGSSTSVIEKASQSILFPAPNVARRLFAAFGTFEVSPSAQVEGASSANPIRYTSLSTDVCQVFGSEVTMIAIGSCIVAADLDGNENWNAAPQVTIDIELSSDPSVARIFVHGFETP